MDNVAEFVIEADFDPGIPSRILDLLAAIDRYPLALRFDRGEPGLLIRITLDRPSPANVPVGGRIRQMAGVRSVTSGRSAV